MNTLNINYFSNKMQMYVCMYICISSLYVSSLYEILQLAYVLIIHFYM